jgi:hypothetical protein
LRRHAPVIGSQAAGAPGAARTGCVRFLFSSCSVLLFVAHREARRRYVEPRFPCSARSLRGKRRRRVVPGLLFFSCCLQGNTGKAAESPERRCASIGSITCAVPVGNGARSTHARMIRPRGSGACDLRQRGRPWPRTSPRQTAVSSAILPEILPSVLARGRPRSSLRLTAA